MIASAYNTDTTRRQIVDKYKRLMEKSTPMKQLMVKQQEQDLEKYKKWLESDQRYVGFGSQLDLKNKTYMTERENRAESRNSPT